MSPFLRARSSSTPSVSARYMQTFAAHVDRLPAEDRAAIRSAVPAATWEAIDRAGVLGWLSGEVNLTCTRAVSQRLGRDRSRDFFRTLMLSAFQTPLLRGLVESTLRIGYRDLILYLPWVSRGFELMFRGCGRWSLAERGPGTATIEIRGLPPEYAQDPYWVESAAGAFTALFDLADRKGSVTVGEIDPERGRATLTLTWEDPA